VAENGSTAPTKTPCSTGKYCPLVGIASSVTAGASTETAITAGGSHVLHETGLWYDKKCPAGVECKADGLHKLDKKYSVGDGAAATSCDAAQGT